MGVETRPLSILLGGGQIHPSKGQGESWLPRELRSPWILQIVAIWNQMREKDAVKREKGGWAEGQLWKIPTALPFPEQPQGGPDSTPALGDG